MQTSRYLAPNRINILANEAGFITEYKPVYSRALQVYKGIDNVLEFKVLNPDQKPIVLNAVCTKPQNVHLRQPTSKLKIH